MIKRTLKTTTGKLTVSIPSNLSEVTIGQMIALQGNTDLSDIDAISILSGIPADQLKNIQNIDDFAAFGDTVLFLSHQIKYLHNADDIPSTITFNLNGDMVTVKVARNLSVQPVGAFMAAREIIGDEITKHIELHGQENWQQYFNPSLTACCQVLAHYFYCGATGKPYSEYEAEEFVSEIKKLGVMEALPISKYFFTCYPNLSTRKTGFFQRLHRRWKNERAYRHLKSLNTSTQ
ncbi:MAG TPA: hypothetical protein VIM55_05340 [Mucilaginibacter sp.]